MLEITNIDEFAAQMEAWAAGAETLSNDVLRGFTAIAFIHIIGKGPQYSGDWVANTRLDRGAFQPIYREHAVAYTKGSPYREGATPAIEHAKAQATPELEQIVVGDKVFISTTVAHKGDSYAFKVESGAIKFRDENPYAQGGPGGPGQIYKRTEAMMDNRFSIEGGAIYGIEKVARTRL